MSKSKSTTAPNRSWDLIGDDSYASRVKEALMASKNNRSRIANEVDDIRTRMLKIPEFGLQATFGSWGLRNGKVLDILGADSVGKSTLLFTLAGWSMSQGSPVYYQETENKLMDEARIKRCLSSDRALADKFFNRLIIDQVFDIQTAIMNMENFVLRSRDPNSPAFVPMHITLVLLQDTFSKLMSSDEAEGVIAYGVDAKKIEDAKEVGGGSNFGAAKAVHAWFRRLPYFLDHYNCILAFGRHQNDKVDMTAGRFGGGNLGGDAVNRTSRGGKGFNQNAALQLIISRIQAISAKVDGVDEKVGVKMQINVAKNSYGPPGRRFYYQINTVPRTDTETYQEPAITFAPYTAEWLFLRKLLPMTMKNKNCFTCKALDQFDASAEDISKALHANTEVLNQLGRRLEISGYDGVEDKLPVEGEAAEAPAVTETDEDDMDPGSEAPSSGGGGSIALPAEPKAKKHRRQRAKVK